MWIKRSLVILPILLFAFLIQSVFWVPGTASVANNDSRQNRIILYMGGNPEDMNPWTSTKTTDSTISDYFYEGVIRYNNMYELEPWLAKNVVVAHEVTLLIPDDLTAQQLETAIREEYGNKVTKLETTETMEVGEAPFGVVDEVNDRGGKDLLDALGRLREAVLDEVKARNPSPATLHVRLEAPPKDGEIVWAVEPDFERRIEARLDRKLHPILSDEELQKFVDGLSEDDRGLLQEALIDLPMARDFVRLVAHRQVAVVNLHQGVWWTDGPFFSAPERTWLVTVNGDEAGTAVADTASEAAQIIRDRLMVEEGVKVEARTYDERFGDDSGPWWGKGPEFSARDVKLTFEHIKNPSFGSPRRSSYLSIEEFRTSAEDPYFVEAVFDQLYSPALSDLTGSVLPYHRWNLVAWKEEAVRRDLGPEDLGVKPEDYNAMRALRSRDRDFALAPSYVGSMVLEPLNGDSVPYWENNLRVRLRRNEFYWNRKPEYEYVDWFVFDPALGSETSEVVFLGGGMDIYSAKDYQVKRYEDMEDKYYVIKRQPTNYEYFGFNMTRDQLKDKRVRLALSMAINVDEIIEYVLFGQGERVSGPGYPVLDWYNNEHTFEHTWRTGPNKGKTEQLKFVPFNMEEAKALLAEAGFREQGGKLFKDGKALRLQFVNTTGQGPRQKSAVLAKERWEQLGVDVDYKTYEWNDYIQRFIMAMNFDVCVLGWSGGLDFDKRQLWHTAAQPPAGLNFVGYSNPKVDEMMRDILKVFDKQEQIELSHKIYSAIASDFPYIFLYSPYTTTIVDRHIVWREQVGTDAQGNPMYKDRPLTHDYIKNSRASWRFFEPELIRREEIPEFTDADSKD